MKTFDSIDKISTTENPGLTITFGNFDGVHSGHRKLIQLIKSESQKSGTKLAVMTFVPHPRKILQANASRFLISSYMKRREILSELGVDYLIELPFTRDFSTQNAKDFLDKYVLSYPAIKSMYLGWDFAFGANKAGDSELVKEHCKKTNISVYECPAYETNSSKVSSSIIRSLIETGDISSANDLLGRPFSLSGIVIKGEGRGKKIGIPTANLQIDRDLLIPATGVYVTQTSFSGMNYRSVTNVGHNPTFSEDRALSVETHIIDFNGDIYGENIEVNFYSRIRSEMKFSSVNELVAQVRKDIDFSSEFSIE
ncbi:MAG: bifunctional riboflavin kinase/FAD synthetase [Bacteriovoracaceae bacterium]|nr:bifunctional riboflavin kinase/FAD synthetase [Bacteriovoracaceae bacterium]